ncbi:multi-sensor hybrid histidine kinase [Trichormus variabilis ATCC 29413]|uniref:histidine kinase n=2 Tax=Anabaena variabilis TaxID=264691 RepID=Q3M9F2_TRIV2|nr:MULTISPECIES: PAS domain-containing protein [Nostocaceae]ABA22384.1 multi-sensor hybrid histidine kinase [Trichormus variabilis ATCC 29413]MBC1213271.1 PAS domain-containing protein [Trichormus variabilis ARAD]MBC1254876.1 PAS domain-containing protein [Trichormus variabilis V5]MBC1266836.1 PAS domain-containing protein [Trichormus variabilis FSR]MBC1301814.1 PAS domain-containing protein [Trichormus variabilis N2B]
MPNIPISALLRFGIVIFSVALACALMLLLDPWLGMTSTPFLLFFSAVMFSAWYGGFWSGVLGTFLSVILSNYFFFHPRYTLSIDTDNVVIIGLFAVQGWFFSFICEILRNTKKQDAVNLQKLRQSEERFRLALSNSDIVVFQQDRDLRYRWIHNYQGVASAEEIIGKSDNELFPASVAEKLTAIKQKVLEKDVSVHEEVSVIFHGKVVYYDLLAEPLTIDGQIQGITCAAVDITERKRSELEKAKLQSKLQKAIEQQDEYLALLNAWLASSPVALAFLDTKLRYVYTNEALAAINGVPQSQHIGRTLREVLPEWATQLEPILQQVMATKQPLVNQEVCGVTYPSGVHRCSLVNYYPVCLPDGKLLGVGVTALDITERKQAEDALRYIAQTSNTLSSSLDYEQTLAQIAKISVPQLADWCSIDIINQDGSIRRLPIAHVDPTKAELARLFQEYAPQLGSGSLVANVLQTGEQLLVADLPDSPLPADQNEENLELLRQIGIKSLMLLPLIAHEQVLGCITFVSAESGRSYNQSDLSLAKDIAYRAALAMENAQLYRDVQQALKHYAESLALLDALLAGAPVAVCFLDKELRYLRINQVLADLNGLSIEEHLGRKFQDVLPKMAEQFEEQLQQVLETGQPLLNLEVSGEALGRPEINSYWLGNYYPVYDGMGKTVGIGIILADVTATKQVEIALRESEERFRAMFDQAAVGITLVTLDGQFLQNNPALCDITGYSSEELSQMKFPEITHPDDVEADWAYAKQVLAKEINGYSLEKRYLRKDGTTVWVNLTASAVWNEQGEPKYALGIIEDINERKQAEAAQNFLVEASTILAASLDYEVALNNVAHLAVPTIADWCAVDILQADWSIKRVAIACVNPAKLEIIEEIRRSYPTRTEGKHPFRDKLLKGASAFYPELPNSILVEIAQDEQHLQLLQSLEMRSLMVVPLYSREQIFGVISFVTGSSGRQLKQTDLALAEDIARRAATAIDNARLYQETQQAKQAAELAMSRMLRLQSITAALSEALTPQQVADVVVNQGLAALGASAGSVVLLTEGGTTLKIIQAIGYPESVQDAWETFPLTATVPIAETARTGEAIFLANVTEFAAKYPQIANVPSLTGNCAFACIPLIVEQQTIGVMALSFATAQKFNEEQQKFMLTLGQQCAQAIARSQLYEAEKNARAVAESTNRIKDEFLAVLSHELRTPLNPIMGWAKLLRTRTYKEETIKQGLETIERNAKLQTQLIDDLLDVSRILRGKLNLNVCLVDLRNTVQAGLETVRLAAEAKSIAIHTILSDEPVQVMGDGDRLQQVIWNLVSNAVKFTPSEGRVEVRLEQVGRDAQIQVIDTGKGITPEFLPYVFEYFRQADAKTTRVFGGLGLGLAIVHHLVELHGGTVVAQSAGEDQGATFTVKLPLHKSADYQVQSAKSAVTELENQDSLLAGVQILLVDDQEDVREFFSFALEQCGATVTAVASAIEALEALARSKADVLLSDIGMPQIDGYMLLRQIRKWSPEQGGQIPAIALTAYAGEIDQKQAIAAGFQKHIAKPADPVELAEAITQLIGRK